jgi:hypothetical protein
MAAVDRLAWAAVVASLAVAPGCSSGSSGKAAADAAAQDDALDGGDLDATVEAAPSTYAPTFTAVYGEILMPICAGTFCHGGNEFLLMTTKDVAYHAMVGVKSFGPKCADSGLTIVEPEEPDASLLYLKVTTPPCGNMMPNGYFPPLDTKQTTQIHDWIAKGALNN